MTITAFTLSHMCRFEGGLPSITFRDYDGGRIQLFMAGKHIATVVPGHRLCQDCEAVLLNVAEPGCWEVEWRGNYGAIANGISALQQTADWQVADDAFEDAKEFDEQFVYANLQ